MAQKRFPNSMFGFDKGTVNTYIENLTRDYEEKLTAKDMEIEKLVMQLKNVNKKYEAIKLEEERILTEKEKISQALVSANEKAEKIVDIKRELMGMKSEAMGMLEKYQTALNGIVFSELVDSVDEVKETASKPAELKKSVDASIDPNFAAEEETDDFFG